MGILAGPSIFSAAVDVLRFAPTAFPKGKPIQKNLDTRYVNLEALFRSLAREGFFGTVLMVFEEGTEALIVFREGTIITAYASGESKLIGLKALTQTLALAKSNRAYVDVFKMEHEVLVALLPLLHGAGIPEDSERSLDALLAEFKKAEFVGAIVVGDQVAEAVGLVYAGIPMGWYDAQGVEYETGGGAPPKTRSTVVRAFALENADTFAAVNLAMDKQQVASRIRDVLFDELKELGMVLYVRALDRHEIAEERQASKAQFLAVVEDLQRGLEALRGPVHARRVGVSLHGAVDTMLDVGF